MKTHILLLSLLGALSLLAESPPETRDQNHRRQETRMLHHLLQMSDSDLATLRQTIERIEQMGPEEKAQLRERIEKLEKMPPEQFEAMRKRFEAIEPQTREAMRQRWMGMTPATRREWREKLRYMSAEERAQAFQEQGFLPAPANRSHETKPVTPSSP